MFSRLYKFNSFSKNLTFSLSRNIAVGQSIPKANLTVLQPKNGSYEKSSVSTDALFGSGSSILVGYPGFHLLFY